MLSRELKVIENKDIVWYVEIAGYRENIPQYKIDSGWYLGTYSTLQHIEGLHIVTASPHIDTTVVRHIPSQRVFDTKREACDFREKLERGEVNYEKV